ncbi:TPA: hypothetical protein ACKP22_000725 [Pseudomonas putida]
MNKLPPGWLMSTFGALNEFKSKTINPANQSSELFELYSVPSFPSGLPEHLIGAAIGSTKQSVLPNDVLVCKINPRINRVWVVGQKGTCEQIASTEWIGFRSRSIFPAFAKYYFSSPVFREFLCSEVAGVGGSLTRAQPKKVVNYPLPVAPASEQIRIADQLNVLLARVQSCSDRLDVIPSLLKRLRQAVVNAASSGVLTDDWRSVPTSECWCTTTVGEVLQGKPRNGYSPKAVEFETPVRSLTLSATTSGRFISRHYKFIDEDISHDSHLWLQPGDILIQRANTLEYVGVSAVFDGPDKKFIYPDLMMKCRPNERILGRFLYYSLSADRTRTYFREHATGTSGNMPKINQQTVMSAPVWLPSLAEQDEIVRRAEVLLDLADRIETFYAAALRQAQRLTPLILSKAFRGDLVPQDPKDEPASELIIHYSEARATIAIESKVRKSSRSRPPRAPREAAAMTKSRQDDDVRGQAYLARHLRRLGGTSTAEELFKVSELPVADFYKQLAWEVGQGFVKDRGQLLESWNEA